MDFLCFYSINGLSNWVKEAFRFAFYARILTDEECVWIEEI